MKGKIAFVAGITLGYVLGTRAGRERYEQIKKAATAVWQSPPVQAASGAVGSAAGRQFDKLQLAAAEGIKKFVDVTIGKSAAARSAARSSTPTPIPATPVQNAAGAAVVGDASTEPGGS